MQVSWRAQQSVADDQRAELEARLSHLSLQIQKQSDQAIASAGSPLSAWQLEHEVA